MNLNLHFLSPLQYKLTDNPSALVTPSLGGLVTDSFLRTLFQNSGLLLIWVYYL